VNSKIKKVLETLEKNGFEAYVVGGYVRDTLLNINTTDVDICTNALPKDIIKIFNKNGSNINYGSISLNDGKYNFDITTFRSESNYDKRKPLNIKYINDLIIDLQRRDFTINSLCMNKEGEIINLLGGLNDLNQKSIRIIGDTSKKLTEDPLRILRAIRFSITLGFKLENEIITFINNNKSLIKTLSYTRKYEELNRIFSSKNAYLGLKILKDLNLLEELEIKYDNIKVVNDVLGIWAQIDYSDNYIFTKSSSEVIKNIREIISKGIIDNNVLFKYNLYISMVAGQILGIDYKIISKMHADLKIKSAKELDINSKDIFNVLNIKPSPQVKEIIKDLIDQVLNNNLENNYDNLKKYILKKWK